MGSASPRKGQQKHRTPEQGDNGSTAMVGEKEGGLRGGGTSARVATGSRSDNSDNDPWTRSASLHASKVDGSKDQTKGHQRDEDLAQHAHKDGPPALIDQIAQLRTQANSCKGRKKRPLGKV